MARHVKLTSDYWIPYVPEVSSQIHKYQRGHALILAAPELTGATRLSATACSRLGAGLVSVHCTVRSDIYRVALPPDVMVLGDSNSVDTSVGLNSVTAVLAGPGGIDSEHARWLSRNTLGIPRVLDAAALQLPLMQNLKFTDVLTPHYGEFRRAFPHITSVDTAAVEQAAQETGAVIVLKGPKTIIAQSGQPTLVHKAPNHWLAKAGTGDVLAGMIASLIAQGMTAYFAACAAVWLHSKAGERCGPLLVASDLEKQFKSIFENINNG